MKLRHFEALSPVCPHCRTGALRLTRRIRGEEDDVLEGLIECANSECRHLYPIVDGIPLLVADLRSLIENQSLGLLLRQDLSERLLSVLAECYGPSSPLDTLRQHLSMYGWTHYADLDPDEAAGQPAVVAILETGLERLAEAGIGSEGMAVDLGCAVGRSTFELARRMEGEEGLVVGVDLNLSMLRAAAQALRTGRVSYPLRRVGLVYEERSVDVPRDGAERVDFWCADALALPFRPETFDLAASLNLIDTVQSPLDHLTSLRHILRPGGGALVSSPFDWSPSATSVEAWVGGHSPYDEREGRSENVLRSLIGGDHPAKVDGLEVIDEIDGLEWPIRLHDRSVMQYRVDLFVLGRK
jgi:SAM-dependent methyltransferase